MAYFSSDVIAYPQVQGAEGAVTGFEMLVPYYSHKKIQRRLFIIPEAREDAKPPVPRIQDSEVQKFLDHCKRLMKAVEEE
jgi:hypothetical protein